MIKQLPTLLSTTKEGRRVYPLELTINGRQLVELIIDPHYEKEHGSYMTDEKIYQLVQQLDQKEVEIEEQKDNFEYFTAKRVFLGNKCYKLVCCWEEHQNYLGIIDAYRQSKYDRK